MLELGITGRQDRRSARDRRVDADSGARGTRVNWTVVLTVIGLLAGWVLAGFDDNRSIYARVSALEAQRVEDSRRMERIEDKVDRILERVKP